MKSTELKLMAATAAGARMDHAQVTIQTDANQLAGFNQKGLRTSKLVCQSVKKVSIITNKTEVYFRFSTKIRVTIIDLC